jgi:hypothetical protein
LEVKKLLKDRKGSVSILFFGFLFMLLLMTFLIIDMGATMENHDYAVSVLQRACNSAVEANILDEYRADRVLMLDAQGADEDFRSFVQNDLPSKYRVVINSVSCSTSPPSMIVTGTITFPTVFSQYGFNEITVSFRVHSTNYNLD